MYYMDKKDEQFHIEIGHYKNFDGNRPMQAIKCKQCGLRLTGMFYKDETIPMVVEFSKRKHSKVMCEERRTMPKYEEEL